MVVLSGMNENFIFSQNYQLNFVKTVSNLPLQFNVNIYACICMNFVIMPQLTSLNTIIKIWNNIEKSVMFVLFLFFSKIWQSLLYYNGI